MRVIGSSVMRLLMNIPPLQSVEWPDSGFGVIFPQSRQDGECFTAIRKE